MNHIGRYRFMKAWLRALFYSNIFILMFSYCIDAQIMQSIQFKHITANDGLSHNWVRCIIQDKYGFIWIGTDDGLNRYDGYDFRVYKTDIDDSTSVSHNSIQVLFEDNNGNLWIGTNRGLNLYDRKNDRFIRHQFFLGQNILSLAKDKEENLWVGTYINLYRLNLKNDSVRTYYTFDIIKNQINPKYSGVNTLFVDSQNNIWVASNGLHLYDKKNDSFINYIHDYKNPHSISSDNVRKILEDRKGRLWVGTSEGLDLFLNHKERSHTGIFIHHYNKINNRKSISAGMVQSLMEDSNNNLWVGIENNGISIIDLKTYKTGVDNFVNIKNGLKRKNTLSNNSIYALYQDKQNNIWIGPFGSGINLFNSMMGNFIHIANEPGEKNSLCNNQVNVFLEEGSVLWIGTEEGLNRWDRKRNMFKHYTHNPSDKKSLGANAVWALCKDRFGNLWVGTWGGGLNKYDYKTETFEHFYHNPDDSTSIGSNNIFSILEDSQGNLWIGTMGGGLNLFDYKNKKFIRYHNLNSGLSTNYVQQVVETKDKYLWVSNINCFIRFDKQIKTYERFEHNPNDTTSISSNKTSMIFEDSKGNIWLATNEGLNLFNKVTSKFKHYKVKDGLPDNFINSIIEDNQGNLWITTNKGLSKFIDAVNLPDRPKFKNFTYEDGLQSNSFNRRSCYKGKDGLIYLGGSNGFNIFDPSKIVENTYIPPVVITEFKIFNQPVKIISNQMVLSHQESAFSIKFAALNYIAPSKNQYAYMLDGFDKKWNYRGSVRTATYTNIDPGEYIFKVKGSNNDGIWNEEGVSLKVIITPPFWQTIWFGFLVAITLLAAIYIIYKLRVYTRALAEKQRLSEAIANAIAKERNLLRTLIDTMPDSIYIKDKECRKIIANTFDVQYLCRKSESEVIGKNDFDIYPKELAEKFYADDQKVIQTGQPLINREEYVVNEKGEKIWLLTTKVPLHDENNQIIGLVGIGRNITELKKTEEEKTKAELEREKLITELKEALTEVKTLSGLIPICASCKKIRDDQGYWIQLEAFIQERSETKFSHGICPECAAKLYPNLGIRNGDKK